MKKRTDLKQIFAVHAGQIWQHVDLKGFPLETFQPGRNALWPSEGYRAEAKHFVNLIRSEGRPSESSSAHTLVDPPDLSEECTQYEEGRERGKKGKTQNSNESMNNTLSDRIIEAGTHELLMIS